MQAAAIRLDEFGANMIIMNKPCNRHLQRQKGFTIVEISLVILISGLLFVMLMNLFSNFGSQRAYRETIEHMDIVDKALTGFKSTNGHFPCPADPTLPPDHPDYGLALPCGSFATAQGGNCSPTTRPRLSDGALSNVVCTNVETREVFPGQGPEYVLIGIVPFRTLAEQHDIMPEYAAFDGYGNRLTYAITERMADQTFTVINPVGINWGAISIFDENGRMTTNPTSNVYYTLISHGEDGKGAYNESGLQAENCINSLATPPTPGLDNPDDPLYSGSMNMQIENCDYNDGIFRSALMALSEGPDYFDDILFYRNILDEQLWMEAGTSGPAGIHIYNTNNGFVGVGTQTPLSPLNVEGDLVAEAQTHAQDGYCDNTRPTGSALNNDPECFEPSLVAGPVTLCGPGEIATGFRKNSLVCEPMTITGAINVDCGTNSSGQRLFARGLVYNSATGTFSPFDCARP